MIFNPETGEPMKSPMARQPFDEEKTDRENGYQPAMVRIEVSPEEVIGADGTSSRIGRLTAMQSNVELILLTWTKYKARIEDLEVVRAEIGALNQQILTTGDPTRRAELQAEKAAKLEELYTKCEELVQDFIQDASDIQQWRNDSFALFQGLIPDVQQWWGLPDVSLRPMMRKRDKPRAEETEETAPPYGE